MNGNEEKDQGRKQGREIGSAGTFLIVNFKEFYDHQFKPGIILFLPPALERLSYVKGAEVTKSEGGSSEQESLPTERKGRQPKAQSCGWGMKFTGNRVNTILTLGTGTKEINKTGVSTGRSIPVCKDHGKGTSCLI